MRLIPAQLLSISLLIITTLLVPNLAAASQVLVTVEDKNITSADLETALASSPFYTQFNTLDENQQAAMRGDMLKRLVTARLLEAEARRLQLDKTPAFTTDLSDYINGVRYQKYLNQLRDSVKLSDKEQQQLRQQYAGSADAFAAASASIISDRYRALYQLTLKKLKDQYQVQLFKNRINPQIKPETVLMQADNFQITYASLTDNTLQNFNKDAILDKLFRETEYKLISQAALIENIDLSKNAQQYSDERLPALLMETKINQWIPNDSALQDYFASHPELHKLKDRWHLAQLVVKTKQQAEELRAKIINGESSLFQLAGKFSIDPEARYNNGDLGWVLQGTGAPEIEDAIKNLNNDEISPVIKTSRGYHLVTVLNKRIGGTQRYSQIKDKLRQMIINENMDKYLAELEHRHPVNWLVMEQDQKKARALLESKDETDH